MEPKKNPHADVHRYRSQFFLIGLSISLVLMIVAFEWKAKKILIPIDRAAFEPTLFKVDIIPYRIKEITPRPEVKPKKKVKIPSLENIVVSKPNDPPTELIQKEETTLPANAVVEIETLIIEPEKKDTTYIFVERMPEPAGGYSAFYKHLQKTIRYPKPAQRQGVVGKVLVKFVVNEEGNVSQLSIEKGIGFGCDEEAMRVIGLSKWLPGKQRGKPVKVQMIQPVFFALN